MTSPTYLCSSRKPLPCVIVSDPSTYRTTGSVWIALKKISDAVFMILIHGSALPLEAGDRVAMLEFGKIVKSTKESDV